MKRRLVIAPVLVATVVCATALVVNARQQQSKPVIGTGTTAIVVDVIVRDGKGNPVTDLRKEDFELYEDGERQDVGDVTIGGDRNATRDAANPRAADPAAAVPVLPSTGTPAAAPAQRFLALVFDRLSPEARALAYKGAMAAVDSLQDQDFVAVYLIDLSLATIQPYTNDRETLRGAVREAASRATAVFDRTATRAIAGAEVAALGDAHPSVPFVASAESRGRPVDTRGAGGPQRVPAFLTVGVEELWESMARDQQGYATTNALLAITSTLGRLPGRKTVVFFAEGVAIPPAVLPHFRNVIATANQGNVSVYTVDAAGLRVHSKDQEIGREVTAMGSAGITLSPTGENMSSLRMMERNEDVLRKDPRTSLTLLARDTGGFLVENTNDLAKAFRQVDADRRSYYLLTYSPRKADFDGKWRAIEVKVPNRRVTVRARSGYLAVRGASAMPVLAYEGPALAALDRRPAPAEIPVLASALVFPDGQRNRIALVAATGASALRFDVQGKTYTADFTILARLMRADGEVVRKGSQPYRLTGPVEQLDATRRGQILFFRQPALDPGTYTLEVAVHDALASRAGVFRAPFVAATGAPGSLQVSSLVLVDRAERVASGELQQENPLYVDGVLVYPNIGEPIRKSRRTLPFYIVVVPGAGTTAGASLEIVRESTTVATVPVALPAPDGSGRIAHIAWLPIDSLPTGTYVLRMTVTQADRREVREARFTLVE